MKQTLIEQIESGRYDRVVLNEIANGRTYAEISRKTGLKKHNITNYLTSAGNYDLDKFEEELKK